jgi:hypothetical protein
LQSTLCPHAQVRAADRAANPANVRLRAVRGGHSSGAPGSCGRCERRGTLSFSPLAMSAPASASSSSKSRKSSGSSINTDLERISRGSRHVGMLVWTVGRQASFRASGVPPVTRRLARTRDEDPTRCAAKWFESSRERRRPEESFLLQSLVMRRPRLSRALNPTTRGPAQRCVAVGAKATAQADVSAISRPRTLK